MPAEDAFVVLYQLRDHPAHQFRLDDKLSEVGRTPRATLNVVDVKGEPCGRLHEPVDTLMFHLPRAALDEIAEDAGALKVAALVAPEAWRTADPVVDSLHDLLVEALATRAPANRLFFDRMMFGLGAHFAAAYGGMRPHDGSAGALAPWQERRAKELLAANLTKEVSLQQIAGECGLSLAYFSRAFKRSTRTTPNAWLQMRRVERAKQLLATPTPLAEIAVASGFAHQSHFTRVFSRATGRTPGDWRRLQ